MSKKATYEVLACQYFVECQMPVSSIAERLNISEKTLHTWKKDGKWEEKRTKFLKAQYSTNQTLYELVHLLADKAVSDYKTLGIVPEQKTLYFIMNMADKLAKLKSFENETAQEKIEELNAQNKESAEEQKISTEDMLQKFFKAVIGG